MYYKPVALSIQCKSKVDYVDWFKMLIIKFDQKDEQGQVTNNEWKVNLKISHNI